MSTLTDFSERTRRILSEVHFERDVPLFCRFSEELKPYVKVLRTGLVLLVPEKLVDDRQKWGPWQASLKYLAATQQNFLCAICGDYCTSGELHHCLVSKQDARGWEQAFLIHHSLNVVLVHPQCHGKATREVCYDFLCSLYGRGPVGEWLVSVSFEDKTLLVLVKVP
jgi:hypothetical protein